MARNKYPEETVQRILDVACRLFLERGYDDTTVQDIVDGLGGLSKGAIYHHFKSKEEILLAVCDRSAQPEMRHMTAIRDDPTMTGREKLAAYFARTLQSPEHLELMKACPPLLHNPRLLAEEFSNILESVGPDFIVPVVRQGVADGSIQTDYPDELAEMIIFVSNLWLNPIVYPMSREEIARKLRFFGRLLDRLGLDIVSPETLEGIIQILGRFAKK